MKQALSIVPSHLLVRGTLRLLCSVSVSEVRELTRPAQASIALQADASTPFELPQARTLPRGGRVAPACQLAYGPGHLWPKKALILLMSASSMTLSPAGSGATS